MVQRVSTVAFEGIEARTVDVQVQVAPGLPAFAIVGLPDKAVSEAKERVRAALIASGLALPARRITINLAPADLPKEGSHYDLPIALGLMAAIGAIPHDALSGFTVLGELGLDGGIAPVAGVLPAAIAANAQAHGLICPAACGAEAAWASPEIEIIAARSLIQLANHFKGTQVLTRPQPKIRELAELPLDLADIKGQESAKRALEVAAAGGHNLLMIGPPGAGKSMLAARLPSILPPLSPAELLEVSMIASVAGEIEGGALTNRRPFRCTAPFRVDAGAGRRRPARQARRDLAGAQRRAVPRRDAGVLPARRSIRCASRWRAARSPSARANHRITYPARFMLVAAMNPCRCGRANDPGFACKRGAECALRRRIPGAAVRAAARPHRPAHRGARRHRRRPDPAAASGRFAARSPRASRAPATSRPSATRHLALPDVRTNAQAQRAGAGGGGARRRQRSFAAARTPPTPCSCPPAAITGCCGSRARSPISTAPKRSPACIWPRRCPTARSPTRSRRAA